jgi:hypothetical protein
MHSSSPNSATTWKSRAPTLPWPTTNRINTSSSAPLHSVTLTGLSTTGRIDLYKRGCFVLGAKQGSQAPEPSPLFEIPHRRGTAIRGTAGWDQAMLRARNQAEQYAKALPAPETAKHRFFVFLDASVLPDNMLVNIASSDAFFLGVLSSRIHVTWALAAGGRLGFGNDPRYNKTRCFEPFPFPDAPEPQRERIQFLGEQLDAYRKRRQEAHPNLTITEMYNVLEELRASQTLSAASLMIHDHGLVSVLRDLHDDLDRAVAEAYGWPSDLPTEDILFRLVALNAARAAEERSGLVRWLRPEFQETTATQVALGVEMEEEEPRPARAGRLPWPPSLPERVRAVRDYLMQAPAPVAPELVARSFVRARIPEVTAILETLTALGQASRDGGGYRA